MILARPYCLPTEPEITYEGNFRPLNRITGLFRKQYDLRAGDNTLARVLPPLPDQSGPLRPDWSWLGYDGPV